MEKFNTKNFLKHKYKAKPQTIDNQYFASKKEANYFGQLKLLQMAGEINFFLMQVPFRLPGGITYRCDFMEIWSNGDIKFVEIKGFETQVWKLKKKLVESLYPIKIEIK